MASGISGSNGYKYYKSVKYVYLNNSFNYKDLVI